MGRFIALLFHDRCTRRWWEVSSTPRPHFTLGKDTVPIVQEYNNTVLQKRGITVLETTGPQVLSPLSSTSRLWRGIGRGKRFFYLKTPRPTQGPNQSYIQRMLGFSVCRPAWAYSWEVEVKNEWNYKSNRPLCFHDVDRNKFTYYNIMNKTRLKIWKQLFKFWLYEKNMQTSYSLSQQGNVGLACYLKLSTFHSDCPTYP